MGAFGHIIRRITILLVVILLLAISIGFIIVANNMLTGLLPRALMFALVTLTAVAAVLTVAFFERVAKKPLAMLEKLENSRSEYEDMLVHMMQHDVLTDLPNRMCFIERLEAAIEEAEKEFNRVAIANININGFKYVNEALGHAAGDELLCEVAHRLSHHVKLADLIAHMSADEFMVLLKTVDTQDQIETLAKIIFDVLGKPYNLSEQDYTITVSIGSTVYPDDGIDAQTLLKNADLALNKARALGVNHHESYYEGLSDEISMRVSVDISLRKAFEKNELVPFFQPIVDAKTGVITSCEALLRWISPTEGIILPARFINLSNETGLILPISEMMLYESLKSARRFHELGHPIVVAVNIPVQVLLHKNFIHTIKRVLGETGMEPQYLNLEITEDTQILDSELARDRLRELREMAIGISVDDFGTGYSSLSYLKRLSPQRVKIDKWFINGIPYDQEHTAIVKAIIALAKSLGIYTTAEGVENEAQRDYLTKLGCTHLQGFLISKPIPENQFIRFLEDNRACG